MKAERLRRIAAGLCTKCGEAPPIPGGVTCEPCRIKQRQANVGLRIRQKADPAAVAARLEHQRRYYAENPERYMEYRRRRQPADALARPNQKLKKYGLTVTERDRQLKRQGGRCAICRVDLSMRRLVVDHCHDGETLRGLLCSNCNVGLGMFEHSPTRLRAAVRYLQTHVWNVEIA